MRPENFDFLSNMNTLWAVAIGAVLATVGGFIATQLEGFLEYRRRERNAALFFGELLATLSLILAFSRTNRSVGDPYGPITMRTLRAARREIDIYDRNRETLFDLRHHELRARIHTAMIRTTMPLEGIFDATREIADALAAMKSVSGLAPEAIKEIEDRIAELRLSRDSSFDFILENNDGQIQKLIKDLEPLAKHSFEETAKAVRNSV
jgi:hypothetical protein